jgi:methylated-DNA-[protein]-cysteine S-methyltransferase
MTELFHHRIKTPIGKLSILASETALWCITFKDDINQSAQSLPSLKNKDYVIKKSNKITLSTEEQLTLYFDKQLTKFDLPIYLDGTPFQVTVWNKLRDIPFGQTRSYKEIANGINKTGAFRAVGRANGRNPIPIIIPCHRVILSNGKLGGYSSGVPIKDWLLRLEDVIL